jgi:hypothetical protein
MNRIALVSAAIVLAGCTTEIIEPPKGGSLDFEPDRPDLAQATQAAPYTGTDETVLEAQATLPTGLDLHAKVIHRTCGPTGGVCHNAKEFPDLHTPANLISAIGAPCNVQSGTHEAVFDRCEQPGDRFRFRDERQIEIGYVEVIVGDAPGENDDVDESTPGLHVHLADPVSLERNPQYGEGRFIRTFVTPEGTVSELPYFRFSTRWWSLDDGRHLVGAVAEYQADDVQELITVGVLQGDHNRNGVFGARERTPVHLIEPGAPERSYLIARLRGTMEDEPVPGSRMPLANQPLSVAEMLAFMCFIEGLPPNPDDVSLASAIDYAQCSYSSNPEDLNLLGAGVTWTQRVSKILEFNCGGCHADPTPQSELNLKDGEVYARLLMPSGQVPELNLIEPFYPEQSYIWLKLTGDPSIVGAPMPYNPLTGAGMLEEAELNDIRAWIEAGAVEDQ